MSERISFGRSPLCDRAARVREYYQGLIEAGVPPELADRAACIRNNGCHSPEDKEVVAEVARILRGGING